MGYVFGLEDARRCDEWYETGPGRLAFELQKQLLLKVWSPPSPQRLLVAGCGAGRFAHWFARQGHSVTGIDPSEDALSLARGRLAGSVRLDRGFAEDLPYEDNEFDTVALIHSLEFVEDPEEALREACRVAARNVLVGAFNRFSLAHVQRYFQGAGKDSPFGSARFFSVRQFHDLFAKALSGPIPLVWRTCITFPMSALKHLYFLERRSFLHLHPFGNFIAMRADLRYRMRTAQSPVFSKLPSRMSASVSLRAHSLRSSVEKTDSPQRRSGRSGRREKETGIKKDSASFSAFSAPLR